MHEAIVAQEDFERAKKYLKPQKVQELNDNLEKFICAKKEYERKAV